jgi:hypothetical protein
VSVAFHQKGNLRLALNEAELALDPSCARFRADRQYRELSAVLQDSAMLEPDSHEKVLDFLLYYGVLGVRLVEHEYFIYAVNYDLKMLKIRAERGKDSARYVLNPAFWPTFGIDEGPSRRSRPWLVKDLPG